MFSTGKALFRPKGDWYNNKRIQHEASDEVGVFAWSKITVCGYVCMHPNNNECVQGCLRALPFAVNVTVPSDGLADKELHQARRRVGRWHGHVPTDDVHQKLDHADELHGTLTKLDTCKLNVLALQKQLKEQKALLKQKDDAHQTDRKLQLDQVQAIAAQLADSKAQNTKLQKQLAEKDVEMQDLSKQLAIVEKQNASCSDRISEAKKQLAEKVEGMQNLTKQLAIVEKQNASCSDRISEAKHKNHALLHQVVQSMCRHPAVFRDHYSSVGCAVLFLLFLGLSLKDLLSASAGERTNQYTDSVEEIVALRNMRRDEKNIAKFVVNCMHSGKPDSLPPIRLNIPDYLEAALLQLEKFYQQIPASQVFTIDLVKKMLAQAKIKWEKEQLQLHLRWMRKILEHPNKTEVLCWWKTECLPVGWKERRDFIKRVTRFPGDPCDEFNVPSEGEIVASVSETPQRQQAAADRRTHLSMGHDAMSWSNLLHARDPLHSRPASPPASAGLASLALARQGQVSLSGLLARNQLDELPAAATSLLRTPSRGFFFARDPLASPQPPAAGAAVAEASRHRQARWTPYSRPNVRATANEDMKAHVPGMKYTKNGKWDMKAHVPGMKYTKNGKWDMRCKAARELLGGNNIDGTRDQRLKQ
jgi:hypothetical protein